MIEWLWQCSRPRSNCNIKHLTIDAMSIPNDEDDDPHTFRWSVRSWYHIQKCSKILTRRSQHDNPWINSILASLPVHNTPWPKRWIQALAQLLRLWHWRCFGVTYASEYWSPVSSIWACHPFLAPCESSSRLQFALFSCRVLYYNTSISTVVQCRLKRPFKSDTH